MIPGAFAHLCRECLDVPSNQCGYRNCPQKVTTTALVTGAAPIPPVGNANATQYVDPRAGKPSLTDASLATLAVDPARLPPPAPFKSISATTVPLHGAPLAAPDNALATRYLSPTTTEVKR